jgi:hypothetical protein
MSFRRASCQTVLERCILLALLLIASVGSAVWAEEPLGQLQRVVRRVAVGDRGSLDLGITKWCATPWSLRRAYACRS